MIYIYKILEKICTNKYFVLLFIPISVLFLLLYSYTTSPLYIHEGMDSAVFKTMGLAMLRGKIPYVDIFDHKGFILYFINALGQWLIPGRLGIFILQVAGLFVTLFFLFKLANLFIGKFVSFIAILLTLYIYGAFIQEGNQCEEWMLPFFTISLYTAVKYMLKESDMPHKWHYGLIYGLCFGITFFIRPNDAIAQIGGIVIGLSCWIIYKKEFSNLLVNILSFIFGFCIIAMPIFTYFILNDAVYEMLYGLIGFNSEYAGGIFVMISSLLGHKKLGLLLLLLSASLTCYSLKSKALFIILPVSFLQIIFMGSRCYLHYYIVLIPIFLIYIILTFKVKNKIHQIFLISIFLLSPICGERQIIKKSRKEIQYRQELIKNRLVMENFYKETNKLLSHIDQDDMNDVWNFNLSWENTPNYSCLIHYGLVQSNIITFASNDKLTAIDNIFKVMPKWVVVETYNRIPRDNVFANDSVLISKYDCVATTDTTVCHLKLYHLRN